MSVSRQLLAPNTAASGNLADDFLSVRALSLALAAPLTAEDCVVQTIPEVSPTKWHLAHVTWFFERFCLLEHDPAYRPFNEKFLELFNSYYHTVGKMHPRAARGQLNRPTLAEVHAYREHVDEAMRAMSGARTGDPEFEFLVTLGINHEQQHQELLLTDIKHVFYTNPLHPAYHEAGPQGGLALRPVDFVSRPGGRFAVGHAGAGFCFDNETPRHEVLVEGHEMADRLVTNDEFREFVRSGAYGESEWWLSDGYALLRDRAWDRPLYWSADLEHEFTLGGWQALDPARPVCHVSYYEADAFARWSDARLPTEFELELAAADTEIAGNTLDRGLLHPEPAKARIEHEVGQIWGDVWEWTASAYAPYPRFRPLAGSLGEYNGKFMANQMVVRGGSCVSSASHLRASYRSFFYPQDRWQFLGFRLVRDGGG